MDKGKDKIQLEKLPMEMEPYIETPKQEQLGGGNKKRQRTILDYVMASQVDRRGIFKPAELEDKEVEKQIQQENAAEQQGEEQGGQKEGDKQNEHGNRGENPTEHFMPPDKTI